MYKVAIIGPESTGKSTLAKELAEQFKGTYVPEYAREYVERKGRKELTYDEVCEIAREQIKSISEAGFYFFDTELIVTKDMSDRKAKMIELGDAFIAFPGGTGTLEEISEVISRICLRHLQAPCIVYNLGGYYEGLKILLKHMVEMGLASEDLLLKVTFAENLEDIKRSLEETRE